MESHAHSNEFGARLIQWALEQSGTPVQTGAGGQLAEGAAANPQRRYRVVAFYGCSTNSYDTALRNTEGFGTREADILVTNRTTSGGAEVAGLPRVPRRHRRPGLGRADAQQHEHRRCAPTRRTSATDPWQFTGTGDNPRR